MLHQTEQSGRFEDNEKPVVGPNKVVFVNGLSHKALVRSSVRTSDLQS